MLQHGNFHTSLVSYFWQDEWREIIELLIKMRGVVNKDFKCSKHEIDTLPKSLQWPGRPYLADHLWQLWSSVILRFHCLPWYSLNIGGINPFQAYSVCKAFPWILIQKTPSPPLRVCSQHLLGHYIQEFSQELVWRFDYKELSLTDINHGKWNENRMNIKV